jgi:hypothetical protein
MRERKVKSYLINFRRYIQDKSDAPMTFKEYMTGIKSFYRSFDIELPIIPKMKVKLLEKNTEIPTKTRKKSSRYVIL